MGLEDIVLLLKIADMATIAFTNWGVDMSAFHALQAKARAENRPLTDAELGTLAAGTDAALAELDKALEDPAPSPPLAAPLPGPVEPPTP